MPGTSHLITFCLTRIFLNVWLQLIGCYLAHWCRDGPLAVWRLIWCDIYYCTATTMARSQQNKNKKTFKHIYIFFCKFCSVNGSFPFMGKTNGLKWAHNKPFHTNILHVLWPCKNNICTMWCGLQSGNKQSEALQPTNAAHEMSFPWMVSMEHKDSITIKYLLTGMVWHSIAQGTRHTVKCPPFSPVT